ncbi:MAG TPA: glycosyltransferase family A protein [Flavobacteriaceae bacterium]|nr:glycosyltransferase family A protein [Flavobacteriaceae bacterium]
MLFNFLKYIRPTWYFNLEPKKNYDYFPERRDVMAQGFDIKEDREFLSKEARTRDLAWRAFQMGFIKPEEQKNGPLWEYTPLPIQDEYRFFRKNFHKGWVFYVLLFRLLQLNNPYKEIKAFYKTRNVKRDNYALQHFEYPGYETFESALIQSNPLVSIIIPTLNRYGYLKDVFRDLEQQSYKNFEVLVVDQTDDFQEAVYEGWNFDLRYWFQEEKALWKARNLAILAARGDYILLYDDDSLIEPDWIDEHLKTLDFFNADISSGVSISVVGAEVPKHYSYFRWSDQLDTGNVMLRKHVFAKIGLFDRQFEKQRMGDGEFGLRAYLAGFKNISNPKAKRVHLKVSQGGLRQMGSWDGWRPKRLFAPRPIPSVLYLSRSYFGNRASRYYLLIHILPSIVPIQYKSNKVLKLLAFVLFPIIIPLILIQVWISWQRSSKKLKQGPLIDPLV